jgi:hypothetical protein
MIKPFHFYGDDGFLACDSASLQINEVFNQKTQFFVCSTSCQTLVSYYFHDVWPSFEHAEVEKVG